MHVYSTPAVVQCPSCLKWWKPGNVSCAVMHVGDGCCHYGDTEVTPAGSAPPGWPPGISTPTAFPATPFPGTTITCSISA